MCSFELKVFVIVKAGSLAYPPSAKEKLIVKVSGQCSVSACVMYILNCATYEKSIEYIFKENYKNLNLHSDCDYGSSCKVVYRI